MDAPRKIDETKTEQQTYGDVDRKITSWLALSNPVLESAIEDCQAAGIPDIHVSENQGALLELMARASQARRILEIGTLGGYSTLWLAAALAPGGQLISLEISEKFADVARSNIRRAGFGELVSVITGAAEESLQKLIDGDEKPFDFIFIDANKDGYSHYFSQALCLSHVGTVILCDNAVLDGRVFEEGNTDVDAAGIRNLFKDVGANKSVRATAIQTVGARGWDGFVLMVVV